jgi:hypothetical protein
MKWLAPVALALLFFGCSKKEDASAVPVGSATAAVAAAATASSPAETKVEPNAAPDPAKAAASAVAPTEPNAPPPHAAHDQAAAAEIHKGNYKKELDSLEKEDLSADRK